jgi:hypothetical protein
MTATKNWFPTLGHALEAEGLLDAWDLSFPPVSYGESRSFTWQDGSQYGRLISVYRDERGMYERPVHYSR